MLAFELGRHQILRAVELIVIPQSGERIRFPLAKEALGSEPVH
ncbi:hypothetical protein AWB67_07486 [Caballeronia terrestris]|jgi:hypothetical protein|uniref:Uncharacterized protein n=1 Tax=Caballeronia terrestris TaxID=1226301 RepID=A0A158L4S1_9BURK|nr:hypothetical protein AWB67_07486 [Caballeronia terrestris]